MKNKKQKGFTQHHCTKKSISSLSRLNSGAGFTLIEFLAAGAIFVVILSIVTTIIVRSMRVYNRIIAAETVNDEVRYALDTISRAVRVSKIESGGTSLVISGHPTKGNINYTLTPGGVIQENGEDITSANITVDTLNFTVSGLGFEGFGIGAQPKVTLTIKAKSSVATLAADSEILTQTTVEQKALDVAPPPALNLISFTLDTDYIEEDAVNGTDIAGGVAKLQKNIGGIWAQRDVDTEAGSQYIYSVIYDAVNNKYVAGGYDGDNAVVWESNNLIAWTQRNVDTGAGSQYIYSVIYDAVNNKYVAGGYDADNAVVWESNNLIAWTQRDVDMGGGIQYIYSVIYDAVNNKYVAGGSDVFKAALWESSDLIVWTQRNLGGVIVVSSTIRSIIYDAVNNKYIAVGFDSNFLPGPPAVIMIRAVMWESSDLVTWIQRSIDSGASGTFRFSYSVIYDVVNNKYVVGGVESANAVVWESNNLIAWTQRDVDTEAGSQYIYSVIYDAINNKYVAGGYDDGNAVVWESNDLIAWQPRDVDTGAGNQYIYSIIYDVVNNKYIAGGYDDGNAVVWESGEETEYPITQPYYITTSNLSQVDTSTWTDITNVTINQTEPANTSLKYLVSFDSRATWKYWDGASAWVDSSLANLQTEGMTKAEIEALVKADWSGTNGFEAGTTLTLDFAVDLATTDADVTPTIDVIVINYES